MLGRFSREKKINTNRGNTLVFVMIAITILALLCVTLITLSFQVYKSTRTHGKIDYAFYSVDSAIEMYINKMWIAQEESIKDFKTITLTTNKNNNENKVKTLFHRKLQLALVPSNPTPTPAPTTIPTMPLSSPFILNTSINSYGVDKAENVEPVRITITYEKCEETGSSPNRIYTITAKIEAVLTKRAYKPVYAYKDFIVSETPPTPTPTGTAAPTPTGGNTPIPTATGVNTPTPAKSPTPTPTKSATPTPTTAGSYPAWNSSSASYAIGAKVSYQSNNYECTQGHTSNVAWDPVSTLNILWKKI